MTEIDEATGSAGVLDPAVREAFERDGFAVLRGFVTGDELVRMQQAYERFLRGEVSVEAKDFCDMSAGYDRPVEEFEVVNIMLPSRYEPSLRGSAYELRAQVVARALQGDDMVMDYDQLVAKPPGKAGAVFHWHQDLAYWPDTDDTRTASFWLAVSDAKPDNGSVHYVPGSHREDRLRVHAPLESDREKSHAMVAQLKDDDRVLAAELEPGDCIVHHERVLHGSPGNTSDRWRRGWVVAFRGRKTVEQERAMGFTHSHNDPPEVLAAIADQARRAER